MTGQWHNANTDQQIVSIVERETTRSVVSSHDSRRARLKRSSLTLRTLRTLGLYNAVHGALTPDDILVYPADDDTSVQVRGIGLGHTVRSAVNESVPTAYTAPELLDDPIDR